MTDVAAISFEPLSRSHLPVLQRWLAEPHVARWWNHDPSAAAVERDFGFSFDQGDDMVVLVDGTPVGLIQLSLFSDHPDYAAELDPIYPVGAGTATIDYFIGDAGRVGRGLGSAMITAFVDRLWSERTDITELVVPVNDANEGSWRALLNAGFRRVAEGEMEPDNPVDGRGHIVLRRDRPA
jgi:aminoglycoside 6'-N-acetyltransferase